MHSYIHGELSQDKANKKKNIAIQFMKNKLCMTVNIQQPRKIRCKKKKKRNLQLILWSKTPTSVLNSQVSTDIKKS